MNKVFGVSLACLLLCACGGDEARRSPLSGAMGFEQDERPLGTTFVYECSGYDFIARLGPGEMAVWLQDRYVVLSQVRTDSGVLYEEGDISFWIKGGEAMLTLDQQRYQSCQLAPQRVPWEDARRRGVDFRAQGNEPGWSLEIQLDKQLLFVGDYGLNRVLVTDFTVTESGLQAVFEGGKAENALRVEIEDAPCNDTMSDDSFPSRVAVTYRDTVYSGCGQSLDYPWEDFE